MRPATLAQICCALLIGFRVAGVCRRSGAEGGGGDHDDAVRSGVAVPGTTASVAGSPTLVVSTLRAKVGRLAAAMSMSAWPSFTSNSAQRPLPAVTTASISRSSESR